MYFFFILTTLQTTDPTNSG